MAGGLEKQASFIMNEMVRRGHEVHLLTWDEKDAVSFYPLSRSIQWTKMGIGDYHKKAGLLVRLRRLRFIRKFVQNENPDVAIGFQYGAFLTTKTACLGLQLPLIQAERNSVSLMNHTSTGKKKTRIFQSMRLANRITVQFSSYIVDYPSYLRSKIEVIPNPVFPASTYAKPCKSDNGQFFLLAVGRLSYQKNFEALIESFYNLAREYPDWRLVIAGEGENRSNIERLIHNRNLSNRVSLLGAIKHMPELYTSCHLLCLPSRWEGFPNVIAEGLAHGLPCIGYSDCAGMGNLIVDGQTGMLAQGNGNIETLTISLKVLMNDHQLRERMGRNAIDSMKKYESKKIFDKWERLFEEMAT